MTRLILILALFAVAAQGCEVTPVPASLGSPYDSATFERARRRIDSLRYVDSLMVTQ